MITVMTGDCVEVMAQMDPESVDAIVCDPPYGLEFMGKEWDSFRQSNTGIQKSGFAKLGQNGTPAFSANRHNQKCPSCGKWAYDHPGRKCECGGWRHHAQLGYANAFQDWCTQWASEAHRLLRSGGYCAAFGGTRLFHRLTCALEDAGFVIEGTAPWIYGSGFPKSVDVSKAIDKANGDEREVVGYKRGTQADPSSGRTDMPGKATGIKQVAVDIPITAPATEQSRKWQGWGTGLKPAWEPIVIARKP